jgi:hypothetical protein
MPYVVKKMGGLALVLLGGLTVADGGVTGQAWEMLSGLILMVLGAGLMGLKILRRNTFEAGEGQ